MNNLWDFEQSCPTNTLENIGTLFATVEHHIMEQASHQNFSTPHIWNYLLGTFYSVDLTAKIDAMTQMWNWQAKVTDDFDVHQANMTAMTNRLAQSFGGRQTIHVNELAYLCIMKGIPESMNNI
jgi:hypothetical protein